MIRNTDKSLLYPRSTRSLTILGQFGDSEVLSVVGSSGQGDTKDQALLSTLELLRVGGIADLLQERDKVLGVVVMSSTQLVRGAKLW